MNMHGFPRELLLKFKPELERAETATIRPSPSTCPQISCEAKVETVSPRSADEPGGLEVVIRVKLSARDVRQFLGIGAAGATARATLSAPDIKPTAAETVEPAAGEGDVQVGAKELSPAMKIFAWRGVTRAAPAAATSTRGSAPAVSEIMPPSTTPESIVETGVSEVFAGDEDDAEECADYTLRAWRDGELVKHLTLRLKKARALQSMHCFARNLPFGTDVALYIGLHEQAANIPIEKLVSEMPAWLGSRCCGE